jgi:hypothetical protein
LAELKYAVLPFPAHICPLQRTTQPLFNHDPVRLEWH